jgi:hypothetical protein
VAPDEARRRTRQAMGGLEQVKEECRDARGVTMFESTLRDLQYGARQLRKSPAFAAVVVASLALGIGANTAIFTLIDSVLLRSLPVDDPERLQFVARFQPAFGPAPIHGFGYDEFRRLEAANPAFTNVAAYSARRLNVGIDGSIEPTAEGHLVSGRYFDVLGVRAIAGRTIGPQDDERPNGHPVAVLSYDYWRRRFGGDPSALGRTISLSGAPFTVIGVTPRGFFGVEVGRAPDIFVPVMMQPTVMPAVENWLGASIARSDWLTMITRLRPGVTPQQADGAVAGLDVPIRCSPSRARQARSRNRFTSGLA